MARRAYGGGINDCVRNPAGLPVANAVVTFWNAATGGTQYTDLLNNSGAGSSSITADTYGQIPSFQSDATGPVVMYADSGGTSRVRMLANDSAGSYVMPPGATVGRTTTGNTDSVINIVDAVYDGYGNLIRYTQNAGGTGTTDHQHTDYDFIGSRGFDADIYGNVVIGGMCFATGPGVPGNRLAFTTACMEVFEGYRNGTVADWIVVFGACTTASVSSGGSQVSPHGLNFALEMTATAAGPEAVTSPAGIYAVPCAAGDPVCAIAYFQAAAGSGVNCFVSLKFFNSAGTYLAADIAGSNVLDPAGTWTPATVSGTVPTGAASYIVNVQATSTAIGEKHRVTAVATFKSNAPVFSRPQTAQAVGGTAFQGSKVGARYFSTNGSQYHCTTGGYPNQQVWAVG